ncbi:hypothetical protein BC940DRAFT_325994 [Gongronella butleri]|nr:hypothetical protein BC940DRAFT_325994 [Gongronella butleri]
MTGRDIPSTLPGNIKDEVMRAVQGVPNVQASQPTGMHALVPTMHASLSTPPIPQQAMPTGMYATMAFANQMMPHADYSHNQQRHFDRLKGSVKVPWAVSQEEKKQYSKIFNAWDPEKNGYITGDKAKEIFTQSGLAQNVLMQIWNLADPNNQGKLNIDEFSVAMHLIYRKLNGYDVPTTLPAELIPPSTRELKDTVDGLKQDLLRSIAQKKSVTSFNDTSLSVPSSPSSRRSPSPSKSGRKTTSKSRYGRDLYGGKGDDDDDNDVGYVSSARRMGPDRSRGSPMSTSTSSSGTSTPNAASSYGYRSKTTRMAELRQQIAEKREILKKHEEALKNQQAVAYSDLPYLDQQDIDDLRTKIRELQMEAVRSGTGPSLRWHQYVEQTNHLAAVAEENKALTQELTFTLDSVIHGLIKQVAEVEADLKAKKLIALKQRAAQGTGMPAPIDDAQIQGTGPDGQVTEADRIRAKAKALIAAKMGKLQQQGGSAAGAVDVAKETRAIEDEHAEFKLYLDALRTNIAEFDDQIKEIGMETSLIGLDISKHKVDQKLIDEHNRFEKGEKVAKDLKEFIDQLAYEAALAKAPDVDTTFESRFPEL